MNREKINPKQLHKLKELKNSILYNVYSLSYKNWHLKYIKWILIELEERK